MEFQSEPSLDERPSRRCCSRRGGSGLLGLGKDLPVVLLLLVLYFMQGIPIGALIIGFTAYYLSIQVLYYMLISNYICIVDEYLHYRYGYNSSTVFQILFRNCIIIKACKKVKCLFNPWITKVGSEEIVPRWGLK